MTIHLLPGGNTRSRVGEAIYIATKKREETAEKTRPAIFVLIRVRGGMEWNIVDGSLT